jgi:hypothetical protein
MTGSHRCILAVTDLGPSHFTGSAWTANGEPVHRVREFLQTRWLVGAAGLLVLAIGILTVRLERFPEWDEAVFLSQSGGLNGIDVEPRALAASREVGTPALIGVIRLATETLANTRLLWVVTSILLLVLGAKLISRYVEVPAPLLIIGYGSYWLGVTFMASFYGYYIAAVSALVAAGCYLGLRADGRRQVVMGLGLGASLSLMMWFRQIEGFLVVAGMLGHAVVVSPGTFWRLRLRGALTTMASGLLLFVVPWIIDSTVRFGSVRERLSVGQSQDFERGLTSHVFDYWNVLMGRSFHYSNLGDPPQWANTVIAVFLVALLITGLVGLIGRQPHTPQHSPDGVRIGTMSVLWTLGILLTSFFLFFIGTVRDRYLLIGLMFLSTAVLTGIWRLIRESLNRRLVVFALGSLAVVWVLANVVVAREYENGRFVSGAEIQHIAHNLHLLAKDRDCVGFSRYGAPQIQFGSGCTTHAVLTPEEASTRASEALAPDRLVFVSWPRADWDSLDLDPNTWTEIRRTPEGDEGAIVAWTVES